jgi:hypothetical protein
MRKLVLLACLMAGSTSVGAPLGAQARDPLERHLIDLEKQSWSAWQNRDVAFWQSFLSDDHVELDQSRGMIAKKDVIAGIAKGVCHVARYTVDRFSFRRFDARTALLVYRAAQETRCGNFIVPSPVWATSLYQKRGGRWVNVLYGQTPIPAAPVPVPAGGN